MGAVRPAGDRDLSARLAELGSPALRSAPASVQAEELGLAPAGPGSLLRQGRDVLVYVRFEQGALARVGALRAAGAIIVDVSQRYQTVTAAVAPGELTAVAGVSGVAGVSEALAPFTAAACPSGDVVSEGETQLHAGEGTGEARAEFSVEGSGVTVGVLSDSFDQALEAADGSGPVATTAAEDVTSGDLPGATNPCGDTTAVAVLEEDKSAGESTDEGRAMAQIVHDLAPGAELAFASAFNGEPSFAKNVKALATAGAELIVDDVFYLAEPFFQEGPVAVAVDEVVEGGVAYFSAAGNSNQIDASGRNIASWEAPAFREAGGCPPKVQSLAGAGGTHCMDFDPGAGIDRTFGLKVPAGALLTVDLQWAEPWEGVGTDLDAFLLDSEGRVISLSLEDNVGISQKPVEVVQWANEFATQQTVQFVITRFAGAEPRLKFAFIEGVAATEYPRSTGEDVVGPTVFGHSAAASAISVGAVPFFNSAKPESYSSRGPARHEFEPVDGLLPAEPLPAPEIVSKPDLVATDCGATTFFASLAGSTWRFCGTSAAAPHATAVAALMLDEEAAAEPADVRTALQASAVAVGTFGPCAVGAGLVEAVGAIEALLSPPAFTPPSCSAPAPEGSVEEARAPGNWGSEVPAAPPPGELGEQVIAANPAAATNPPRARDPRTFIERRPPKLVRTRNRTAMVVFRFGSDLVGASFACRIDAGLFRSCPARLVRRFGVGLHTVRVVARDDAGNRDPTPARYRFRVKRVG